jgi:uncharacterized OB-fold protein
MTLGPVTRDADTAAFFDATASGEFLLRRCPACGAICAPQSAQCERCAATGLDWRPASGEATLVSWTVSHGKPGTEPVILCIAELAEGPWWWARLEDADLATLTVGARLRIAYRHPAPDSEVVPVFVPAGPPAESG